MNYVSACQVAQVQSKGTAEDPKGCCTKYVEATLKPGPHDPLVPSTASLPSLPGIDPQGFFVTDWYSGACVACYDDGKWRDLR